MKFHCDLFRVLANGVDVLGRNTDGRNHACRVTRMHPSQLMGIRTYPGYVSMGYDTNGDGEVVRERKPNGKVSRPLLIFWDINYDG